MQTSHEKKLEQYYNKFNEDKRLTRRHGIVEFKTSMHYIHEYLKDMDNPKILDIGAGTGRYSIALANEGYDVTAVELCKPNLGVLKAKNSSVKAFQGNALDLSRFNDESFDLTLLFGPMYHLISFKEKVKALNEAKRVTKDNGIIMVAYVMNDYSVITYAFVENHMKECLEKNMLNDDFHINENGNRLYSYVRLEDIDKINKEADVHRIKIIAADGPADYLRRILNAMDEETFNMFIKYHLSTCERMDMMGASSHTVDILRKKE